MTKRIAVARFGHEGNSFASVTTALRDFETCEWATGDEVPPRYRGTNTEIGGALAFLDRQPGWQPTFLRCCFATPSGEVERETFETIMAELERGLAAERWDAVYLGQHGAMQVVGLDHADFEIVRRVRAVIGDAPLAVSYDLHANITQPQLDLIDACVGYKCHPHTDMAATAEKTLRLLWRKLAGEVDPVAVVVPMDAMLPSINARTTDGPMAEVAAFARGLERGANLLDVTVYQGYAYGDRAFAGGSTVVVADGDREAARRAAKAVNAEVERVRDRLFVSLPDAAAGLAKGLDLARREGGPIAVIDMADHPGAGANPDTPGLLRDLLALKPEPGCVFVYFWDADLVARAIAAGIGATIDSRLGGRLTDAYGPPVVAGARILRATDGRIVSRGPFAEGFVVDYGPTVVLDVEGVEVIVTSLCKMVTDPAFFDLHGIDLAKVRVLAIKAKNQFRAAFTGTFRSMIDVDTIGPAMLDFTRLPFRRVPNTRFPFGRNAFAPR